jgi:hypothetical protein
VTGKRGGEGAATASEERERASCGDEARRERRERGEVLLASASPIILHRVGACDRAANHECSSVPVYAPWPTGFQLMGGLISCTVLTCFLGSSFDGLTWGLYEIA